MLKVFWGPKKKFLQYKLEFFFLLFFPFQKHLRAESKKGRERRDRKDKGSSQRQIKTAKERKGENVAKEREKKCGRIEKEKEKVEETGDNKTGRNVMEEKERKRE